MNSSTHVTSLRARLSMLWRRKWIVVAATIVVAVVAILFSLSQPELYQSSAQVLLSRQNLANSLTGTPDPTYQQADANRVIQTQAAIASGPEVARRALEAVGVTSETPTQFLANASVAPQTNADILVFKVKDTVAARARALAGAYANQFTVYRRELDTKGIERARNEVVARMSEIARQPGGHSSSLYTRLADKEAQLRTLDALQTSNAYVIRRADHAVQVQPRTKRNAVLAIVLGLLLGVGLAFLREALDTRVRSAAEIGRSLDIPLLARVPAPSQRLRQQQRLTMIEEPRGAAAEAYRMLRTSLAFVNLDREAKVIMVTSAIESEGKSTTLANLAVAFARAGRRTVLVDLDLRRPLVGRFFDLRGPQGLTAVALGQMTLDEALVKVDLPAPGRPVNDGNEGDATSDASGSLHILAAGPLPPDAGEFVQKRAVSRVLEELRGRADIVLVDAPPILRVGDPMTLSASVDGIIVVTRLAVLRRPMLTELSRLLSATPATKLGFVAAGAETEQEYGGDYYGYGGNYEFAYDEQAPGDIEASADYASPRP